MSGALEGFSFADVSRALDAAGVQWSVGHDRASPWNMFCGSKKMIATIQMPLGSSAPSVMTFGDSAEEALHLAITEAVQKWHEHSASVRTCADKLSDALQAGHR